jgi:hypothetical protein
MQSYLMDQLHKQEFTLFLADAPLNVIQTHFHSCASPITRAWVLTRLNTTSFHLSFAHFLTTLHICFSIAHDIF